MTTKLSDISHLRPHMIEDYSLIWLAVDTNEANNDYRFILERLRNEVNDLNIFTDLDECVDFLTDLEDIRALLIIDDTNGQKITPLIHDTPQLDRIYVFSDINFPHSEWIKEWPKVKDMYATIQPKCEASQLVVKKDNDDSIVMSFVPINGSDFSQTRDELEPSFMYTQIFKEILLEMNYDEKSIENFITFCRLGNHGSPKNIDQFENEYHNKSPIWWYTSLPFIYEKLNFALRTLKADIIIKMGFFIFDLHHQITQLYQDQVSSYDGQPFIVYRGQGLSKRDFEKLRETRGGLMSFNNFLSTTRDRNIALSFAQGAVCETDKIGILFEMTIDPRISFSPFADIRYSSSLQTEQEILFSMHTVFRVDEIKPNDNNNKFYQVELQLTADDDEQLCLLTKHIRNDSLGDTTWKRLGNLLYRIGQSDKIEELYTALLEQTSSDRDRMSYYNQLFNVKYDQGDYEAMAAYGLKMIEIDKKTRSANNSSLTPQYDGIGFFCCDIGENSRTLVFYKKSPSMDEGSLPANNIAEVDNRRAKRSRALLYQEALVSYQKFLVPDHPCLATSYSNIAGMFENIEEDSEGLLFNEKLLEIRKKTLRSNHRDLALSYYIMAALYRKREEHSKALSFYKKSLKILKKVLPENHPHMVYIYNEMGLVYNDMQEYSKALLFYRKALEIGQRSLLPNHSHLEDSYNNIASVYHTMTDYSNALFLLRKSLPKNNTRLAFYHKLFGPAYYDLEEYSKALSLFEKLSGILEKTPTTNYLKLESFYNNIGSVYYNMAEYTKALVFYEKALAIHQKNFPSNHPQSITFYNNIGTVYSNIDDYSKALSYFERAVNISKLSLSADDSNMKSLKKNIAFVKNKLQI